MKLILLLFICSVVYGQKSVPELKTQLGEQNAYVLDLDKAFQARKLIQPISRIAEDIQFIPLETMEDCLLDEFLKRIIITKDDIFIFDYTRVYRFGINGKYKNTIGKIGSGPGEYIKPRDIVVDPVKCLIYVLDAERGSLLKFDYEGFFIEDEKLGFWSMDMMYCSYNLFLFERNAYNFEKINKGEKRYSMIFYNPIIKQFVSKFACNKNEIPKGVIMCSPLKCIYGDNVYLKDYWSDSIFVVRNNMLIDLYAVIENKSFLQESDQQEYMDYKTGKIKNDKVLSVSRMIESGRYTILVTNQGVAFFDKKEQNCFMSESVEKEDNLFYCLQDDLYGKADIRFNHIGHSGADDYIYTFNDAYQLIENKQSDHMINDERFVKFKKMIKTLKQDDNPVLILVKLKK